MFTDLKKLILKLSFFLFLIFTINANPFLGNGPEKQTPSVRPPTTGGFMVEKQLEFKASLGEMLRSVQQNNDKKVFWSILAISFLYGMLHAAGPGHRKTVIFSMFLARKARWGEPMAAAFLSAGIHGGSALILILIFQFIFKKIATVQINDISLYMEGITYLLLMALTLWFIIRTILSIKNNSNGSIQEKKGRGLYTTLLVTSFFPCPGVIMIMTFSAALGVLSMGIYSVLALSLGMGVTISLVGYLALLGRESIFSFFKNKENTVAILSSAMELLSYLFLFFFSFWMVFPFLVSFFH